MHNRFSIANHSRNEDPFASFHASLRMMRFELRISDFGPTLAPHQATHSCPLSHAHAHTPYSLPTLHAQNSLRSMSPHTARIPNIPCARRLLRRLYATPCHAPLPNRKAIGMFHVKHSATPSAAPATDRSIRSFPNHQSTFPLQSARTRDHSSQHSP